MNPLLTDIAATLEKFAPLHLQEDFDNAGWQVLCDPQAQCSGVMLCVDPTPQVIAEAADSGCNLVVSHHPLLFKPRKKFTRASQVECAVMDAIRLGVSVYSSHTPTDSAIGGINSELALRLGLVDAEVLIPKETDSATGLGAIGILAQPLTPAQLADKVKQVCNAPVVRCSRPPHPDIAISRVALCGGAGGEFIPVAIAKGANAYITSDTRHHDFVDHASSIFIIDTGHFESEQCCKEIFYRVITKKFPNFAVRYCKSESDPILYL